MNDWMRNYGKRMLWFMVILNVFLVVLIVLATMYYGLISLALELVGMCAT